MVVVDILVTVEFGVLSEELGGLVVNLVVEKLPLPVAVLPPLLLPLLFAVGWLVEDTVLVLLVLVALLVVVPLAAGLVTTDGRSVSGLRVVVTTTGMVVRLGTGGDVDRPVLGG